MHLLHFILFCILTGLQTSVVSKLTLPSTSITLYESGIHPCLNSVIYTFLDTQGHIHRLPITPSRVPHTKISHPTWQLLGNSITSTDEVKNLGVTFDFANIFAGHITKVCRACYYHLKDLGCIQKFLSVETAALLENSMISSRIGHCNSLLYDMNEYNVAKLQAIQNALSRIVFRLDKTSHVTPYLQKLNWLRKFIPCLNKLLLCTCHVKFHHNIEN